MKHTYIDEYSNVNSFFNRLDPRAKIISLFTLIFFIILGSNNAFIAFFAYAALIIFLILLSRIPLIFVIKRSFVIIPFVLIAAIFIPFVKKGQIIAEYPLGSFKLTVTYNGLMAFYNILIRSYLSILCMILLTASTKFSDLLKAFEILKAPKLITMVVSFMYRYLFIVQDELMRMLQAKESRSVGGSAGFHIKALANMVGVLFVRTYERSESVYLAMCARGFDGKIRTINNFKLKRKDLFFMAAIILSLLSIRLIGK